jgi:hypothetical protein
MIPSDDQELAAAWMAEFARVPLEAPPPGDPAFVWWKAQLMRRWDAERRALRPIEVAEQIQVAVGAAGALLLLAWLWHALPVGSATSLHLAIGVCSACLVAVLVLSWARGETRTD